MKLSYKRYTKKGVRILRTPIELKRLGSSQSPIHQRLADIVRKAEKSIFLPKEREWIHKIETKRSGLQVSEESIQVDSFLKSVNISKKADEPKMEKVSFACSASISPSYGRLIFKLVRDTAPKKCLELGTGLGISTAFISSALSLNGTGRLVTLEGSSSRSIYAQAMLKSLKLNGIDFVTGPFKQTLTSLLEHYQNIDFCFIDGHHHGTSTVEYYDNISSVLADGAIVIIDDINWSDDMKQAWKIIRVREEVVLTIDTYMMGICLIKKNNTKSQTETTGKQSFKILYL